MAGPFMVGQYGPAMASAVNKMYGLPSKVSPTAGPITSVGGAGKSAEASGGPGQSPSSSLLGSARSAQNQRQGKSLLGQ